jgi:hypothetical protein
MMSIAGIKTRPLRSWYMFRRISVALVLIALSVTAFPFGIEHVVITKPVKSGEAKGAVLDSIGTPLEGALVEVLNQPKYLLQHKIPYLEAEKLRHKLGEQTTKADGQFEFELAPGKYEIRVTKSEHGFNPLSYVLIVKTKAVKVAACVYLGLEGGGYSGIEPCNVNHPPHKD